MKIVVCIKQVQVPVGEIDPGNRCGKRDGT